MIRRMVVSFTYLSEGGNRRYRTEVIEYPNDYRDVEAALCYVRCDVSSEGVLLGFWPTSSLPPTVPQSDLNLAKWGEVLGLL